MRRALLAIVGAIAGAAIGLVGAFVLIYLWFDVLGLPAFSDAPKPGLEMLVIAAPLCMLAGGITAAVWLVRRDRAGRRGALPLVVFGVIGAAVLVYLVLLAIG